MKRTRSFVDYILETILNKLWSIVIVLVGVLSVIPENDITGLIFTLLIAIPLFFAKENWFN